MLTYSGGGMTEKGFSSAAIKNVNWQTVRGSRKRTKGIKNNAMTAVVNSGGAKRESWDAINMLRVGKERENRSCIEHLIRNWKCVELLLLILLLGFYDWLIPCLLLVFAIGIKTKLKSLWKYLFQKFYLRLCSLINRRRPVQEQDSHSLITITCTSETALVIHYARFALALCGFLFVFVFFFVLFILCFAHCLLWTVYFIYQRLIDDGLRS